MQVVFSNLGKSGTGTVRQTPAARFLSATGISTGPAAALPIVLDSSEVQVLARL